MKGMHGSDSVALTCSCDQIRRGSGVRMVMDVVGAGGEGMCGGRGSWVDQSINQSDDG